MTWGTTARSPPSFAMLNLRGRAATCSSRARAIHHVKGAPKGPSRQPPLQAGFRRNKIRPNF